MAFENEYKRGATATERVEDHNKKTILPFFGFELVAHSESSLETYGGNTYVTQVGTDTYKVSTSDKHLYTRTKHYLKWRRKTPVFTDYELESKVQKWLKENKFNDIWTTPYIAPTPEEYHQMNGYGPKDKAFRMGALGIFLLGVILTAALAVFGGPLFAALPEFLQGLKLQICAMPFMDCAFIALVLLYFKHQHNKKHRAKPMKEMSQHYQDEIRKQYYAFLVHMFGEDIGTGMKNLSIQREEDQKPVRKR